MSAGSSMQDLFDELVADSTAPGYVAIGDSKSAAASVAAPEPAALAQAAIIGVIGTAQFSRPPLLHVKGDTHRMQQYLQLHCPEVALSEGLLLGSFLNGRLWC